MNLTPKSLRQELMSEVEKNKALLSVGDRLYSPGQTAYKILEISLEEDYMAVVEEEAGEIDYFCFESLQLGWVVLTAANKAAMSLS